MFDTLGDRLQASLGDLRKRGRLDEETISKAMREIRLALLEADVNFKVVKQFTATVKEELEALAEVAGKDALKLITFKVGPFPLYLSLRQTHSNLQDDPINRRIVSSWPARFDNSYPCGLGFVADEGGMVPIVRQFQEDIKNGIA